MDSLRWIILFMAIPAVLSYNTYIGLGDNCTIICNVLYSVCENNKCICEKNYFELNGECAAGLGASCFEDNNCKLSNTICSAKDRNCKCHPNFVAAPDNSKCLSKLPDKCTKADECLAPNSECKDGRCQCLPGRSLVDGECVFKLGSYCEKSSDCGITNSECVEKKCACIPHYFELLGECVKGVNASCYHNNQCKAKNSVCLDDMCQCEENFAGTPDYQCLPIAQFHKPCKYDSQCSGAMPHTSCKVFEEGQRCECADKYFFKVDECYPRKYVPDKCDRWDDCFTPFSYCQNGQCACLPSYKFENEACNSSIIARPLIYFVGLIVLGMKLLM